MEAGLGGMGATSKGERDSQNPQTDRLNGHFSKGSRTATEEARGRRGLQRELVRVTHHDSMAQGVTGTSHKEDV